MKNVIVLSIVIMIAFTVFAEQSFRIKFHSKNGEEPLLYNIYDIQKIGIRNISDKYVMIVYFRQDSSSEYRTNNIDTLKFMNNQLNIYLTGGSTSYIVSDIDSIIFKEKAAEIETVKIGEQIWTVENLNVDHYRNGDPIPQVTDPKEWANLTTGAWCYYDNDPENGKIYGKLYNWYAVNDPRGLAPSGYHVPSDAEWTTLKNYLESNSQYWCDINRSYIAKALAAKERWSTYSYTCVIGDNLNANNSSCFSALPGGYRSYNGGFYDISNYGSWWSSSEFDDTYAWNRYLVYGNAYLYSSCHGKVLGFSARCVRD